MQNLIQGKKQVIHAMVIRTKLKHLLIRLKQTNKQGNYFEDYFFLGKTKQQQNYYQKKKFLYTKCVWKIIFKNLLTVF